jgi:thimet oligopeptidase
MSMKMKALAAALLAALALTSYRPMPLAAQSEVTPTIENWNLSAAQIKSSCPAAIATARKAVAALAALKGPYTFANTVLPLENLNSDLNDTLVVQTFLFSVALEKNVRSASLDCNNNVAAFGIDETANPAIYAALVQAKKSHTAKDVYDRALTDLWIQQYQLAGAGLPAKQRAEFVAISKKLNDLQNRAVENFANDTTTIELTKDEAAGLPADFLASLKTASDASYVIPVNDSTYSTVMSNLPNAAGRKRFFLAYDNIQVPVNVKALDQEIALRDRLAHLLGFSTFAAYQMATRTVTRPSSIEAFLDQLDAHLLPSARGNVAALATLKARETGDPRASIDPWDVFYYVNDLQKTKYAVDRNEVRQYFPAPHVVDAILKIYQTILGVTFTVVSPANNWNPDVTEYAVSDTASGRFIGTFLLDLYPREGKPGGAFNAPILPVRRLANGLQRAPISTIIVSEWPAPLNGKPALLTHGDVTTFFHEFGHDMAALLTTVPYESLTQFRQDFVEAPSQMLENFTWDPTILKMISSNVDTGQPLPDELIAKMIDARCASDRLCNAYAATQQIVLSVTDLKYHTAGPKLDTTAVWAQVSREYSPVPLASDAHPQAQFTHILGGGYAAGYYVYLWSLVYAQDMFTAFQKGGLESPVVGMRYRKTILEPARTYSPDVEVANFLGRPMSPAAFYAGFDRVDAGAPVPAAK